MSHDAARIYHKVMLPAPPETVYDILTNAERLAETTGLAVEGAGVPGGYMTIGSGRISIRFQELERGRWISMEWTTSEWPLGAPPSRVEMGLRAIGQGTDLRLSQTGVPAEIMDIIDQIWYDAFWNPMFEALRSRPLY